MNEMALRKYLGNRIDVVINKYIYTDIVLYYGIDITDEYVENNILPANTKVYLIDPNKNSKSLRTTNVNEFVREYAHEIAVYLKDERFVNFEVWIINKDEDSQFKFDIRDSTINEMIDALVNNFYKDTEKDDEYGIIPKTCFSRYKTIEYMQYKYVNDREIKEWVGSATIIDNGLHSPKKTVRAGHIIDSNKVVHKLYMNDYILRAEDSCTFVIISEDVFNALFDLFVDGESLTLIHNEDDIGCDM